MDRFGKERFEIWANKLIPLWIFMEAMPAGLLVGIPLRHHESTVLTLKLATNVATLTILVKSSMLKECFRGPKQHILGNRLAPG
jgi:hypothetical protein